MQRGDQVQLTAESLPASDLFADFLYIRHDSEEEPLGDSLGLPKQDGVLDKDQAGQGVRGEREAPQNRRQLQARLQQLQLRRNGRGLHLDGLRDPKQSR